MATLINMELSAAEAKQEVSPESEAPKYPWGLCISLDDEALKKLGMDKLPEVGTKMRLMAMVDVSGVSTYSSQNNEGHRSMDLQITEMSLDEGGDSMSKAAGTLYGN